MNWTTLLLSLPLVLPLLTSLGVLLTRGAPRAHAPLNIACMVGLLGAGVALVARVSEGAVLVTHVGSWPAPFGIPLVADPLSAVMVLVTGVVGLATSVHALAAPPRRASVAFHAFAPLLFGAACGVYLTGDLFNLYVWFEVTLIASFVLMALDNEAPQLRGTVHYLVANLVASSLLLVGVGLLYGLTGTLNLAVLASRAGDLAPARATVVASLFLVAFGTKAAMFPLGAWLPAAYPTPSATTTAMFSGLLTKVAVYALLRVFTLVFSGDAGFTHGLLLWVAGFTMLAGVLGAVVQDELRRLLSFHIISQIGYMIMGLALLTPLALLGAIFFAVHNILAKSTLFLVSGVMARLAGGTYELERLGGFYRAQPLLAGTFLIAAMALAGLPPLPGFWGKLILARAGLDGGQYILVTVSLGVSLLTLFSMLKIWTKGFLPAAPAGTASQVGRPLLRAEVVSLLVMVAAIVGLSLLAGPACELMLRAAHGLLEPRTYVEAVLRS